MEPARNRWGLAAVVLITLGACAQPEVPADRFYRISIDPPGPPAAEPRFIRPIRVERPQADGLLGGRAILYSTGGGSAELLESHYHYWVAPPPSLVRDQLLRCLEKTGVAREVVTEQTRVDAPYSLVGRLLRFEQVRSKPPHAVVEIKLGLRDNQAGKLLLWKSYHADVAAADGGMAATVDAFSAAISGICSRLAADLARL